MAGLLHKSLMASVYINAFPITKTQRHSKNDYDETKHRPSKFHSLPVCSFHYLCEEVYYVPIKLLFIPVEFGIVTLKHLYQCWFNFIINLASGFIQYPSDQQCLWYLDTYTCKKYNGISEVSSIIACLIYSSCEV